MEYKKYIKKSELIIRHVRKFETKHGKLEVGFLTGNMKVVTQKELDKLYNTRDKLIYNYVLDGKNSILLKYDNQSNIITLTDEYIQDVLSKDTPTILERKNNIFGTYDSVIIPNYMKYNKNFPILAFARDCAVIVVLEKNTGSLLVIHAGRKPLFSGIINMTFNEFENNIICNSNENENGKLEYIAYIMPHIHSLELGPELIDEITIYHDTYIKDMCDLSDIITKGIGARSDRIYLNMLKCIYLQLSKYIPLDNIYIANCGNTERMDDDKKLVYGSLRGSNLSKKLLKEGNYISEIEKNNLEDNIDKLNSTYIIVRDN